MSPTVARVLFDNSASPSSYTRRRGIEPGECGCRTAGETQSWGTSSYQVVEHLGAKPPSGGASLVECGIATRVQVDAAFSCLSACFDVDSNEKRPHENHGNGEKVQVGDESPHSTIGEAQTQ